MRIYIYAEEKSLQPPKEVTVPKYVSDGPQLWRWAQTQLVLHTAPGVGAWADCREALYSLGAGDGLVARVPGKSS